jgi:hypothetical protein
VRYLKCALRVRVREASLAVLVAAKPKPDAHGNPVPADLAESGDRLWRSVADEYELDVHEQLLLLEACRCADRLDRLAAEAAAGAVTVTNFKGDQVANPAMVEARQQAIVLSRLIASLRMPSGEEDVRPQRRGASRAPYRPRPLSAVPGA